MRPALTCWGRICYIGACGDENKTSWLARVDRGDLAADEYASGVVWHRVVRCAGACGFVALGCPARFAHLGAHRGRGAAGGFPGGNSRADRAVAQAAFGLCRRASAGLARLGSADSCADSGGRVLLVRAIRQSVAAGAESEDGNVLGRRANRRAGH